MLKCETGVQPVSVMVCPSREPSEPPRLVHGRERVAAAMKVPKITPDCVGRYGCAKYVCCVPSVSAICGTTAVHLSGVVCVVFHSVGIPIYNTAASKTLANGDEQRASSIIWVRAALDPM